MTRAKQTAVAIPEIEQAEAAIVDMAKQSAPMVQRAATHRDRIDLAIKELESERFDLISRRDLLKRQAAAVEEGLTLHIQDIEATIRLYEGGINSTTAPAPAEQTE